jgi:V8-like Glu-specific endopeptidase
MNAPLLATVALALVTGCGASQVKVLGAEDPEYKATQKPDPGARPHAHNDSTIELPSDEQIVEPDHPAVGSTQERALVHIHAPKAICSGVVIGPRLILTAHQCVAPEARAAQVAVGVHRVEVASSTFTWTNREASHVVVPACEWAKLDLAVIILKEPVEWVKPLKVTSAPGPGGGVQALGFGKCVGETRGLHERTGAVLSSEPDAVIIDVPLCRGDVGGPVVERAAGDLVGVISHQDDPDGSPRRTTTIVRFDTTATRALVAQAAAILKGDDLAKLVPLACE